MISVFDPLFNLSDILYCSRCKYGYWMKKKDLFPFYAILFCNSCE